MSNQWIGAYEGSPARLYDEFSFITLILCTCVPVLFPFLLEDAERPSWSKSAQNLSRMVKVIGRQDTEKMDLMLVVRAQVAAHGLSEANKAVATGVRTRRGLGRHEIPPMTFGSKHPLGEKAAKEAELIAGLQNQNRKWSVVLSENFAFKAVAHLLAFYDIPAVKVVTRVAVHLSLLVLHIVTLASTRKPSDLDGYSRIAQSAISGGLEDGNRRPGRAGRMLQDNESLGLNVWNPNALFEPTWIEIALFSFFCTVFLDRCHRSVKLWQQRNVAGGGGQRWGRCHMGMHNLPLFRRFCLAHPVLLAAHAK